MKNVLPPFLNIVFVLESDKPTFFNLADCFKFRVTLKVDSRNATENSRYDWEFSASREHFKTFHKEVDLIKFVNSDDLSGPAQQNIFM